MAGPNRLLSRTVVALGALLAALNAYICLELFYTPYLRHMESIEGAYIGLSRYILQHPRDLNWFPWWYGGIPFQNSYPPFLHMLVAGVSWTFGISPAMAHHVTGATFYCLGPVALMLLGYALSGNLTLGFCAGAAYSLISPAALLMRSVRMDLGSYWWPRRLQALGAYGDGPHGSSVTLLTLAMLALHLAMEKRGPVRAIVAAVALALVVLTNWLGAFALAIAAICYLLPRFKKESGVLGYSAAIGLIAYGLAAPWIPPSTIADISRNAQFVAGNYTMGAAQFEAWGILLIAEAVLFWILTKARASLSIQFCSYFSLAMVGLAVSPDWFHTYLMPQSDRYQMEMEMGLCLLVALGLGPYVLRARKRYQIAVAVMLLVFGMVQTRNYKRFGRRVLRSIDIRQTVEYEVAEWLQTNLPGQRVFATGSIQFWLNAFADNPQVSGGFDQGVHNHEITILHYGIPFTQKDGAAMVQWLRVLGVQAVVVSGPTGRDAYNQNWRDPEKFNGVLPEIWRNGGDAIYRVPQRTLSLAHAILPADVVGRAPVNVVDVEPVRRLDAALENPALPAAEFIWKGSSEALIRGVFQPEHVVFVQTNYQAGWHAFVNGSERVVKKDGLGFMIVEPGCSGACEIRLVYDGGVEMRVMRIARVGSVVGMVGWLVVGWWAKRESPGLRQGL